VNSHGVEDTTAPFHGRSAKECGNGPLPDIEAWRQQWADRNAAIEYGARGDTSAVGNRTVSQSFTDVTNTTWSGDGWDIVGLTVDKLGHSWPTTAGLDQSGRPNNTATFNFTSEVMIPFFDQHVLPEEYVKQW
jgi:poly(3-hydroxybutyrate) depolymerase